MLREPSYVKSAKKLSDPMRRINLSARRATELSSPSLEGRSCDRMSFITLS